MLSPWLTSTSAQQLLDRVVARVNGTAITLTDVRAALGLGMIEVRGDDRPEQAASAQLIDRELLLEEVARFPPPEPPPAAIEMEVATLKGYAGGRLPGLMQSTGLDDRRIRELARDTRRIQAYLDQRFGTAVLVTDEEVQQYYRAHRDEFTRNGRLLAFEDVEAQARERASAERRRANITQWIADLHSRSEIVEVQPRDSSDSSPLATP